MRCLKPGINFFKPIKSYYHENQKSLAVSICTDGNLRLHAYPYFLR